MRKLAVGLAVALVAAVAANVYQVIPEKSSSPAHSAAYQRIDGMLAAIQKGDYKKGAEVLSWWCANQWVDLQNCEAGLKGSFQGTKMQYKMLGETQGSAKYVVVTALIVQDDPLTAVNEPAVCRAKWDNGEECKYAGVYSFGMALAPAVLDVGKKKVPQHWYAMWID